MIPTGLGGYVNENKIVAIMGGYKQTPLAIKRRIERARDTDQLLDLTFGRKTRTVIFTDDGQVILATAGPGSILKHLGGDLQDKPTP